MKIKSYPKKWVNGKQITLQRFVIQQYLGRELKPEEIVHHVNRDINDNRIGNLKIVSRSQHRKLHPEIGRPTRFMKVYNISPDEVLELFKSYTIDEIAKKFHCSNWPIQAIIKRHGLREKIRCRICGEFARHRRRQLCQKHYYQLWRQGKIPKDGLARKIH